MVFLFIYSAWIPLRWRAWCFNYYNILSFGLQTCNSLCSDPFRVLHTIPVLLPCNISLLPCRWLSLLYQVQQKLLVFNFKAFSSFPDAFLFHYLNVNSVPIQCFGFFSLLACFQTRTFVFLPIFHEPHLISKLILNRMLYDIRTIFGTVGCLKIKCLNHLPHGWKYSHCDTMIQSSFTS